MCEQVIKGQILNTYTTWKCNKESTHLIPNTRVNESKKLCDKHFNAWYKNVKDRRWFKKKFLDSSFKINGALAGN